MEKIAYHLQISTKNLKNSVLFFKNEPCKCNLCEKKEEGGILGFHEKLFLQFNYQL